MLYQRIKELREVNHLSQSDVAQLLQITETQYGKYETGLRALPARYLIVLADYYDVSTDYIVERTDRKTRHK